VGAWFGKSLQSLAQDSHGPLSGFNTFVEARLHHVFSDNVATQFIPVTFGISF